MTMTAVDEAFIGSGFVCEVALVVVLLVRREFRRFPIFLTSIVIQLISDPPMFWVGHHLSSYQYAQAFAVSSILDYALQLGVLIEIAHSVLHPARPSLPRRFLWTMAVILVVGFVGTLTWALGHSSEKTLDFLSARLQQLNFVFAFMRMGLFAAIAGFSQMLGITWRNHVIRLAAGLAFYSAVSLAVQLTLSHLPHGNQETYNYDYYLLNHIQVTAYLSALVFWVWSFSQKDAPRREFTPQMERILVTISQAARRNRVSLTRSLGHK